MNNIAHKADGQTAGARFLQPLMFVIAFGLLYYDSIIHNVSKWNSYEGSHWPLILAVSCYLVWIKRHDFQYLSIKPAIFTGSAVFAAGCFILFSGHLSNTITLQQISMIPTLLGAILLLRGWEYLKTLFIPVVYLVFMTGLVEALLSGIAIYFQLISAWLAAQLLELTGMPVLLSGTIIELPHIALEVIKACSGTNNIVSLMALSVPLAVISKQTIVRKIILVVASLFIGIFANGVRIFGIGIYAIFNRGADLHGPSGIFAQTFIFFLGMIVLIILNKLLSKKKGGNSVTIATVQKSEGGTTDSHGYGITEDSPNVGSVNKTIPLTIAGMLFLITLGLINFYTIKPFQLPIPLSEFPQKIADFKSENLPQIDQRFRPFAADEELLRRYVDASGNRVDLYIGYFEEQNRERKLIDYRRGWMHEGASKFEVAAADGIVSINQSQYSGSSTEEGFYFWYILNGRVIADRYTGKLYTFLDGLLHRQTSGAVVVIKTNSEKEEMMPFLREVLGLLKQWQL